MNRRYGPVFLSTIVLCLLTFSVVIAGDRYGANLTQEAIANAVGAALAYLVGRLLLWRHDRQLEHEQAEEAARSRSEIAEPERSLPGDKVLR